MFEKMKAKKRLMDAFKFADIRRSHMYDGKTHYVYPKIHDIEIDHKRKQLRYVFTLADGIDPKKLKDDPWVFKQVFGPNIDLDGKLKRFVLTVFAEGLPKVVKYDYDEWRPAIIGKTRPIIVGKDLNGRRMAYDMDEYPHLLLAGETGSGKSSLMRAILTTLMLTKSPDELRFIMADMKRSEMGLYRNLAHVDGVYMSAKQLAPALKQIKKEMARRGDLLDKNEKTHVRELSQKLPYIIVAIDEVALLKKDKEIMHTLEDISSVGRSLGVLLFLSVLRPDHQILDGKLKNNLTVRISGRQSNEANSRIVGTPGAHEIDIDKKGRMIAVLEKTIEVQAPFLEFDEAKRLLQPFKIVPPKIEEPVAPPPANEFIFGQLDDEARQ